MPLSGQGFDAGFGVEARMQSESDNAIIASRRGVAAFGMIGRAWRLRTHWRAEVGYARMHYRQLTVRGWEPITHSGVEFAWYVRQHLGEARELTPYFLGGVMGSVRANCGPDQGSDATGAGDCHGDRFTFGWGVGAGVRASTFPGLHASIESRLLARSTATRGSNVVTFGLNLAVRR
jgi:hypothetical protein